MKMRREIFASVIAGLVVLLAACTNPFAPSSTAPNNAALSPEVKSAVEQYVAKVNAHDAVGAGELYAEDPAFSWVENGRIVYENRAAAISGLTNFLAGFPDARLEAYDTKVTMLTEDAAVATFKITETIAANSQASLKSDGVMSLGLAKRDGTWKILTGHKSANGYPH